MIKEFIFLFPFHFFPIFQFSHTIEHVKECHSPGIIKTLISKLIYYVSTQVANAPCIKREDARAAANNSVDLLLTGLLTNEGGVVSVKVRRQDDHSDNTCHSYHRASLMFAIKALTQQHKYHYPISTNLST